MAKSLNDIRRRRQVLNVELVQEAQRFMHSPLEIRRWPLKGMEEEERILRGIKEGRTMKEEIGKDIEEEDIFIYSIAILDKEKIRYFYIFYSHIGHFPYVF